MKKILAPLAALAAGLALAACAPKPAEVAPSKLASDDVKPDVKKAPPTDLEQLAQRLVTQSAAVKEGEIVLVSGGPQDLELIEDVGTRLGQVIEDATSSAGGPHEQVEKGFAAYFRFVHKNRSAYQLLFGGGSRRDVEFAEAVRRVEDHLAESVAALIEADVDPFQ